MKVFVAFLMILFISGFALLLAVDKSEKDYIKLIDMYNE